MALAVRNPPANAGNIRGAGSTPRSGRSPGGEHGNPLQYSCRENPTERGAWRAAVHRVAKSRTQLKRLAHMPAVRTLCLPCGGLDLIHRGGTKSSHASNVARKKKKRVAELLGSCD